jgi:cell wall-associated NlpC family hydrolase
MLASTLRALCVAIGALLAAPLSAALAYNGSAAAQYADQYATSYNSLYPSFANKGGDCANFVSQALNAGGILPRTTGTGDATWFMTKSGKHSFSWSVSWVNAQDNSVFLTQYLPGATVVNSWVGLQPNQVVPSGASQGDVVLYDWNNDGVYDHESLVTTSDGQYVDAHTNNRLHAYWTLAPYNSSWMTTRITVIHIPPSTT